MILEARKTVRLPNELAIFLAVQSHSEKTSEGEIIRKALLEYSLKARTTENEAPAKARAKK